MRLIEGRAWLVLAASAMAALPVCAQQFSPHIGYVYPAGGQRGKTFTVTVGGQFLDGVTGASMSGNGVQVAVAEYFKPLNQGQFNRFREELKELTDKRAAYEAEKRKRAKARTTEGAMKTSWTPEDEKRANEIRAKMATFIRRPTAPQIVENVTVMVTIQPDAAVGERELRLATPNGLTNPMTFCVGQLPEYSKKAAKPTDEQPNKGARFRAPLESNTAEPPLEVKLPAVVNGQVGPGGVDRVRFAASKGQHLVVVTQARELIPYISDAVPGWFQATMALYDASGKEVNYAGNFRFHPDPVMAYEIPADGEYTLRIWDSIFRGREDFVYRITVGELPFISSVFPLGAKAGGKNTNVEIKGWNLPQNKLNEKTKDKAPGIYPVSVKKGEWTSNRVPFAIDTLPEKNASGSNHNIKSAQSVKLPIILNGRIEKPGEVDVFKFDGKAGEEIVAEVFARRLDSPLDSILRITDAGGKQIAANDDFEDRGSGLLTHHADSRIMMKLPANGTYYVHLADTQNKGGAEYAYRLRISKPQPDYSLRVVPASINARAGTTVPITVYALRKDGFTGDIALKLKDAPAGFKLSGAVVPGKEDKVRITLTVPANRFDVPLKLHLEGRSTVNGKEAVRVAVPAEDMMQAFAYRHLVPAQEWQVRVTPAARAVSRAAFKVATDKPVRLAPGGTTQVKLTSSLGKAASQIHLALSEPPEGITIKNVQPMADGVSLVLTADAKAKAGTRGNLIVDAFAGQPTASKKNANATRRFPVGTVPAIPFEIVQQ